MMTATIDVVSVRATPNGGWQRKYICSVPSVRAGAQMADDLQREHDRDADPVRTYVTEKGIPVYAGLMPDLRPMRRRNPRKTSRAA